MNKSIMMLVGGVFVALLFVLNRAAPDGATPDNSTADFEASARVWVARQLRDPSSAEFTYTATGHMNGKPALCGFVKGKNGFGGYGREQRFIATEPLVVLFDSGSESFAQAWVATCPSAR